VRPLQLKIENQKTKIIYSGFGFDFGKVSVLVPDLVLDSVPDLEPDHI
jgi:hypothetical protein